MDKIFLDELADADEWTNSSDITRTSNTVVTQAYETPARARYIVVRDTDNPNGKPQVKEIYVAGVEREAAKADKIAIYMEKAGQVIGETDSIAATVVDQYGEPFEGEMNITVEGAAYANSFITANAKGLVTITATAGDITEKAYLNVADPNDYCAAGAQVIAKSEGAADNTEILFDGGKDINEPGAGNYVLAAEEPAGEHTHSFTVKLAKPYNIDMIALLWEGACPADYDIFLGSSLIDLRLCYSQKDKEGLKAWNDRFSGKEMKEVQYIMVVTTKNATGYGIKLHDLKVYGTASFASVPTAIEVAADDNNVVAGTQVTLSAMVKDQYGAEMEVEGITYSCKDENATITGDKFTAAEVGQYTITANYGEGENAISADITINVITKAGNLFTNETEALTHTVKVNGNAVENVNSFLGNELQIADELPATLEYEFDKARSFSLLNLRWEAACPSTYSLTVTYADETTATVQIVENRAFGGAQNDKIVNKTADTQAADNDVAGIDLSNVKKLTFTLTAKDHNYPLRLFGIDAYGLDEPVKPIEITTTYTTEYSTLILPFDAQKPGGMEVYDVKAYETTIADDYLLLTLNLAVEEGGMLKANTPYVVKYFNQEPHTYKGFATNEQDSYTSENKLLTGVVVDTKAAAGDFVLQNKNDKLAFYRVAETEDITIPANQAYLNLEDNSNVKVIVFFLDDVDAIKNIATSERLVNVYDLNGTLVRKNVKATEALKGLHKGIYVVNGAKKAIK